jgi:hypothetical protein
MKGIGFDESLYKEIIQKEWISGDLKKSKLMGIQLKEEFEFMAENINQYTVGNLSGLDKERFEQALLGFHTNFPEKFKATQENWEELIGKYNPDLLKKLQQNIAGQTNQ